MRKVAASVSETKSKRKKEYDIKRLSFRTEAPSNMYQNTLKCHFLRVTVCSRLLEVLVVQPMWPHCSKDTRSTLDRATVSLLNLSFTRT